MGSIVRTGGSNIDRSADLRGLSTDTKPTRAQGDNVPHGSTWYNMDDCTRYMYNADNDTWYNIPNGGGGTGDMQKSVYDPTNAVANAGGIDSYVGSEIDNAITEVEGNIAPIANNLINDTVGWTNKNLLPITLDQLKAINTSGTWEDNVYTYRGITITVDIFNNLITGINVNGANTAGSVVFKLTDNFVYQFLSEDKYYISDGVDTTAIVSGSAYISVERKKGESGESHYLSTNNEERSTKFTVDYSVYDYYFVNIYIPNNSSINNAVFYPMIRRASISDDTYEPYTETVKQNIFNLNSAVGNLASRVGIAEGNITTLNEIKANKSDLGTASTKNAISVVTDSSDLVESGAVYDAIKGDGTLLKDTVGWTGKNLYNAINKAETADGITITKNEFGEYTITGKATALHQFSLGENVIKAGDYILNGCPPGGSPSTYDVRFTNNAIDNGQGATIHLDNDMNGAIYITVRNGYEFPSGGLVFRPMIRKADIVDPTYEPYHASVEEMFESLGGTLACNQLVKNGNFANTSNWSGVRGSISVSDNELTYTISEKGNSDVTNRIVQNLSNAPLANHVVIAIANIYLSKVCNVALELLNSSSIGDVISFSGSVGWNNISAISKKTDETAIMWIGFNATNYSVGDTVKFKNVMLIDLTQLFGSAIADYIYSLEQATTGAGVAYFRKYFPNDYYEYSADNGILAEKADNSVIAPVENGTTASQDYAVGDYFIKDTILGKTKAAISSGGTFTKDINYEETDVAKELTELYKYIGILTTPISAVVANNLQPRFKDITSDFYLGTLRAEIAAGDFSNIRVGDYIIGQTTGSKYYVACLDWMFNKGDQTNATYQAQAYGQHHLGLMLFKPVGTTSLWLGKGDAGGSWQVSANDKGRCPWNAATDVDPTSTSAVGSNDTNITRSYNGSNVSGYMGSFIRERMDAILLPQCFQADFGSSNVLMFRNLNGNAVITDKPSGGQGNWNGCTSGWGWYDRYLDLPSEVELYGSRVFGSAYDIGAQCERLPMFKNADINAYFPRLDLWTKAVASSSRAALRASDGRANGGNASGASWACPLACVR